MKKADVIIQARLGSTRLLGKVLLEVLGKPILEYIVQRIKNAKSVSDIAIATSMKGEDLRIVNLAESLGVKVFRGSEKDVLDRFYQAAKIYKMQHIIRICADCPLMDPGIINKTVSLYFESHADYCSNILDRTFPDGLDVEVFTFGALEHAWNNADLLSEREHVTPYIRKRGDIFKLVNLKNEINLSSKRWTLDKSEDFELIKSILESLYIKNPGFNMEDVLRFLGHNAHLEDLNRHIMQGEGYLKSLREDKQPI